MAVAKSDEQLGASARFRQRIVVAIAIISITAAALLLVWAIASAQHARGLRDQAISLERHTATVLLTASKFASDITEAQSAERGYLLTGNPAFLESYENSWRGAQAAAVDLRSRTLDNPRQARNVPLLQQALAQRRAQMDAIIELKARDMLDENRLAQLFGQGKVVMDALRMRAAVIAQEERRLLALRRAQSVEAEGRVEQANNLLSTLGALLVAMFAIAMFAALRLRSQAVERQIEARSLARVAETQSLFQLVIDSSTDPIFVKNRAGELVYANERVAKIYRATLDDIIGRKDADFLPDQIAAVLRANDLAVMESGESQSSEEIVPEDGSERVFLSLKTPWRQGDEIVGIIGISRDITDLKREEKRLQGSNAELEARVTERTRELTDAVTRLEAEALEREAAESRMRQMQKMESIGKLSGGIAHDFNNMLAIVIGSLDLARKKLPPGTPEPVLSNLDNAQEGASRAAALTARLLAYARQQPLAPQSVNLNDLITDVCRVLERTLGDTIELEVKLAPAIGAIHIDVPQLESAIINTAVNARDAMPDGGRLIIATAVSDGRAVIRITDTGEGMSSEVAARAFDPFYTTKDIGKGTGMGLSQVQGFIVQSGGEVSLHSEPSKGTTVEMALPMSDSSPAIREEALVDAEQVVGKGATVLVVEDEALVRKVAVAALEDAGHTVFEAGDGEAALQILAERDDIELLMTDIAMPRMDGRELAGRARETRPDLRILFTTGYDAQAGADNTAVLQKPYLSGELLAAVEATLASH